MVPTIIQKEILPQFELMNMMIMMLIAMIPRHAMRPLRVRTARAQALANPATTVTQGTLIPAILETAIDTDVPGYVRAVVSQDVKSFDGKNVLIPRSSRLVGQYQSGLQAGQKRAYVIWTRLIRPDGASVNLQSPGIGFDGTTGLPGDVDSRFFQRFGSAMLLSVVGGLSAIGSGGASVIVGGGGMPKVIFDRFFEAAGGRDAKIVVVALDAIDNMV